MEKQVGIFAPGFDRTEGLRKERASLTPEQRIARAKKGAALGGQAAAAKKAGFLDGQSAHKRWHVNRGVTSPTCKFCIGA